MARSKGERAIMREEKRALTEKRKRIEEANKMLIPVPKATQQSLNLISFDPSGTFRFSENRWVKVFGVKEENENMNKETLSNLVSKLKSRIRITMQISGDIIKAGKTNCFVTLMLNGETYDEVRSKFSDDEKALSGQVSLYPLTVDEVFDLITKQSKEDDFSYASFVRGKKDWKKQLPDMKEESNYLKLLSSYGESCFCLSYPKDVCSDVTEKLRELGCPVIVSVDVVGISQEDNIDFNRSLEKKYNQRFGKSEEHKYMNVSYQLLFLSDSLDAKNIIEKTIFSIYSKEGYLLGPSVGMQEKVALSILSLGLVEHSNLRNVSSNVIDAIKL